MIGFTGKGSIGQRHPTQDYPGSRVGRIEGSR